MAKPKVFATHSLFDAARSILQESCEVEYWAKPERPPREEVLRRLKDKEGLICLLTEKINEEPRIHQVCLMRRRLILRGPC